MEETTKTPKPRKRREPRGWLYEDGKKIPLEDVIHRFTDPDDKVAPWVAKWDAEHPPVELTKAELRAILK